jgi:hypothetical protein
MKNLKKISQLFTFIVVLVISFTTINSFAQDKKTCSAKEMKDCKMNKKDCKKNMKTCSAAEMKDCKKDKKSTCCAKKEKTTKDTKAVYSCPMHSEVTSYKPGVCPKCKMDLEKK